MLKGIALLQAKNFNFSILSVSKIIDFDDDYLKQLCSTIEITLISPLQEYMRPGYFNLPVIVDDVGNCREVVMRNTWFIVTLIEGMAEFASLFKRKFRFQLMHCLFPLIQCLGSSVAVVSQAASASLLRIGVYCNFDNPFVETMIAENIDYLIDSIAFRLRYFEVFDLSAPLLLHV